MQTSQEFFFDLLNETKKAFQNSPIKQCQEQLTHLRQWNYAVCETPIQKNKGIILGLNWGGTDYPPQKNYPEAKKDRDWSFMTLSMPYINKYMGIQSIEEVNYTNLCFFRTTNISYLKDEDWEISLPLFEKYTKFINPPWILLLGNTGVIFLKRYDSLDKLKTLIVHDKIRRVIGYKGILFGQFQFFCVPHSQAHISTKDRNKIWEKVTNNKINEKM